MSYHKNSVPWPRDNSGLETGKLVGWMMFTSLDCKGACQEYQYKTLCSVSHLMRLWLMRMEFQEDAPRSTPGIHSLDSLGLIPWPRKTVSEQYTLAGLYECIWVCTYMSVCICIKVLGNWVFLFVCLFSFTTWVLGIELRTSSLVACALPY